VNSFIVQLRWSCLECSPSEAYRFPSALNPHVRKWYNRPGVYRWAVFDTDGRLSEAYIGETESVYTRLYQYLHPGKTQQTNLRLKAYLHDVLSRGLKLEYQVLEFDSFQINSLVVSCESLSDPHIRKFMEAFAVSELRASGCKIMNLGRDSMDKGIDRAIAPLNLSGPAKDAAVAGIKSLFQRKRGVNP
jgi:hypothetical protein